MGKVKRDEVHVTKGGEVVTPEVATQLAEEAERGYDLSEARPQIVGRPALGDGGTSPRIAFRLASAEFNRVRQRAEDDGVTISELARRALRRYIADD